MKKYDIKTTDKETLRKWFYLMTLGRAIDEKAPSYLLQSLGWSYHAPYAGHDGIQLAMGQVFDKDTDFLFPYYRDMLTVLSAGMAYRERFFRYGDSRSPCRRRGTGDGLLWTERRSDYLAR